MSYKFNIYSPYDKKYRHRAQAEYLDHALARKKIHEETNGQCGIQKLNYVGGRGAGKTTIGVIDMAHVALVEAPLFRTFWSELTYSDIDRILIPELEMIVPQELWTLKTKAGGYRYIEWASGHRTDLLSRFSGNSKKRAGLGANMIGGWFDELATNFDESKINDIANSIRAPRAPFYFIASMSTPLQNGYEAWCNAPDAHTVHASSWDNPHLSKAVLDSRARDMSPEQVQQELKGLFVPVGGRIWKHYTEKVYPHGNLVLNHSFDRSKPWFLSVDLGGHQSAAQVWQIYDNNLLCVEEWTPNDMSFEELLGEIIKEYCRGNPNINKPQRVWIGHDVNTANSITGSSGAKLLNEIGWYWAYPAAPINSKDIQRQHASNLLYQNKVLFSVRRTDRGEYVLNKQHFSERKSRGILRVMKADVFPENSKDVFNKDKGTAGINALEDDRDAFLYACVLWKHPSLLSGKNFYK